MLDVDPHPLLELAVFTTALPAPLGELATPGELLALLALDAPAPFARDEPTRVAVRELLRAGGYKPTGRGKPSSEYLVRASGEGELAPINLAVDACNAVSLHSGLPISVVDLERLAPPLRVGLGAPGASYVFNAGGQEIDVEGLLCLHDAHGPCANAVKDAQRTKTGPGTTLTLSIVWSSSTLPGRAREVAAWYRELLEPCGARCSGAELRGFGASGP